MVSQVNDGAVEFRFYRPQASTVEIAGGFNDWDATLTPMRKGTDGWWRCRLELEPGCYEFRYKADGEWFTDFAAFGIQPTGTGWNSVVLVEPPPVETIKVNIEEDADAELQAA